MKIARLLVVVAMVFFAANVNAEVINLNDLYNSGDPFSGDTVNWSDVVETNDNDPPTGVPYYQSPAVFGNTLTFNPVDFRAEASPGPSVDLLDVQMEMIICDKDGVGVPMIHFLERGDYEVLGTSTGTANVSATVNYFWEVLSGASAGASGNDTIVFSDSATPNATDDWEIEFEFDLPAGTECVRFEFDNRLSAQALDGASAAFISKKQFPGITVTVPEPSAGLIGMICSMALFAFRRRR